MTDMGSTIAPKSDQLNADDLIQGARTITVTGVKACPGSAEQPIAVYFEGDNNKPYKPCKSMRRVMVTVWGTNGGDYVGRSMTLYRDPAVQFGGVAVGGIRISHMSHIEEAMTFALTASRTSRKPYTVQPLTVAAQKPASERVEGLFAWLKESPSSEVMKTRWANKKATSVVAALDEDAREKFTIRYNEMLENRIEREGMAE
jgi:hypothetical protein